MEEEDEISDVYKQQLAEHSAENKLMEEAAHCTLPQCDGFQEFDEFGDPELLQCFHAAEEIMAEMMPVTETMVIRDEMGNVEAEVMVETSDAVMDTEAVKMMGAEAEEEREKETTEMEMGKEAAETESVREEVETVAAAEEPATEAPEEEPAMEALVEEPAMEALAEEPTTDAVKETAQMEAVNETAAMEAVEEEPAMEVVNERAEMEALNETTEMEAVNETAEVEAMKEASETGVADGMEEMETEEKVSGAAVAKETTGVEAEELPKETVEMETETETDVAREALETEVAKEASESEVLTEAPRSRKGGGKRKRGRVTARVQSRAPPKKREEEDVCFICFDGGNLVLCDRRGCPKAYHPSCVNRDEAFFRARGRWNCGWHICSQCQKSAVYMCYTCTYSLCKGCVKESGFSCVRGNKGFCVTCMRTVMLIEQNVPANKGAAEIDFDDKSNWEYLFKDYWLDLKGKLSITYEELSSAKNPWKGSGVSTRNEESSGDLYDANDDQGSSSDGSLGHSEARNSATRKRVKKQSRSITNEESSPSVKKIVQNEGVSASGDIEWASNELIELVAHMRDGDKSVLSQYDFQGLLLEYIKRNKLRDPRKKSQIICDSRLQNLFGKARVGHFEMLKLLESHFLIKESPGDTQAGVSDGDAFYVEAESNTDTVSKAGSDKRRKARKRAEERERQTNLDDYAAIDVHNVTLVYLKRNLMEDLLDDMDNFQDRVIGSFVRIRISGAGQKQDMYRLVQVVGIGRASEPYKTGKKTTDVTIEILNLNKTEVITIDTISNQEFSEEECKRLRQSIKCGFISRLTVGEIQEKAKALQAVRVKDLLEAEVLRLSHLRDRASEHGRKKDLRECVEKLELLNTPEERARRLEEIPEIHADPNMDPSYISDDEDDGDDKRQDDYARSRDTGYTRKGREQNYPGKGTSASNDGWSGGRKTTRWESSRNLVTKVGWDKDVATAAGERSTESSRNQGRDAHQPSGWETPKGQLTVTSLESGDWNSQPTTISGGSVSVVTEVASTPGVAVSSDIGESDKIWHYQDPAGKIQGPFNMTQLRKWSKTGYFPSDLRIWKASEKQEDSILLNDALLGKFQKEVLLREPYDSLSQHGTNNLRVEKPQNDGTWKANLKDASSPANGSADGWGTRSGQAQNLGLNPTTSFSGQSSRMSFHHAREGQVGGNTGRWDSSQNRGINMNSTSGFQSGSPGQSGGWKVQDNNYSKEREMLSAVVAPTIMTKGLGVDQGSRNDSSNLPTPTPKPSGGGWTVGQGTENMLLASSTVPGQATLSGWGTTLTAVGTGAHQSSVVVSEPNKIAAGWGEQPHSLVKPLGGVWGSDAVSPSLHKAAEMMGGQQKAAPEPDSLRSLIGQAVPEQPSNANLAAGSIAAVPGSSGLASSEAKGGDNLNPGSGEGQVLIPMAAEKAMLPDGKGLDTHSSGVLLRLDDIPGHSPEIFLQGTSDVSVKGPASGAPVSESLPSGSFVGQSNTVIGNWSAPMVGLAGQPASWDVGSTTSVGNIQNNSASHNVWNMGSAIQPTIPVNTGWTTVPTEIPNAGWGMTPENSNQGWGPAQGNMNMGWGIAQQQASPAWGTAAPGNANMAWGATQQGNANAGLDPSAANSNIWANQQKHPGDRFSGQGDRGFQTSNSGHGGSRPWNRSSGGGGPSRGPSRGQRGVCRFHESGHCKKGASCDYLHT